MRTSDAAKDAMEHLKRLCVDIVPRPVGSETHRRAADYVAGVFAACGLQVELQPFPCPDWQHHGTRLELHGAALDAAANTYSPACDVLAPIAALGMLAELEHASLEGRSRSCTGSLLPMVRSHRRTIRSGVPSSIGGSCASSWTSDRPRF